VTIGAGGVRRERRRAGALIIPCGRLFVPVRPGGRRNLGRRRKDLLPSLIPLRTDFKAGDLRVLYVGWLLSAQHQEVDEEAVEPPVPPGLGSLSPSLKAFIEFMRIDADLVAAAEKPAGGRAVGDLRASANSLL
ncbi:MAG: hypothetical protein ACRDV9_13630, partial [Acidimicrobiia bacterium]